MIQEFTKINIDDAQSFAKVLLKDGNRVTVEKHGSKIVIEWVKPPKEAK
jgi:hypothetical protein